jgi:hypothetical protein
VTSPLQFDAGSLNGTLVNGVVISNTNRQPGQPVELVDLDHLEFGSVTRVQVRCSPSRQSRAGGQQQQQMQGTTTANASVSSSRGAPSASVAQAPKAGGAAAAAGAKPTGPSVLGMTGGNLPKSAAMTGGGEQQQQHGIVYHHHQHQQQEQQPSGQPPISDSKDAQPENALLGIVCNRDQDTTTSSSSAAVGQISTASNIAAGGCSSTSGSSTCHPGLDPRSATWHALSCSSPSAVVAPGLALPSASPSYNSLGLDRRWQRHGGGEEGAEVLSPSGAPPLLMDFPAARLTAALQRKVCFLTPEKKGICVEMGRDMEAWAPGCKGMHGLLEQACRLLCSIY